MQLSTNRLTIRPITANDASFLLALLNSEDFIKNIRNNHVQTTEQVMELIKNRYTVAYPDYGLFIVERQSDNKMVGTVSYIRRDNLNLDDIGYAFLPEFFGQGYATEAASALVKRAKDLNFPGLHGVVDFDNLASQHILKKLGFTEGGTVLMEGEETPIKKYTLMFNTNPYR